MRATTAMATLRESHPNVLPFTVTNPLQAPSLPPASAVIPYSLPCSATASGTLASRKSKMLRVVNGGVLLSVYSHASTLGDVMRSVPSSQSEQLTWAECAAQFMPVSTAAPPQHHDAASPAAAPRGCSGVDDERAFESPLPKPAPPARLASGASAGSEQPVSPGPPPSLSPPAAPLSAIVSPRVPCNIMAPKFADVGYNTSVRVVGGVALVVPLDVETPADPDDVTAVRGFGVVENGVWRRSVSYWDTYDPTAVRPPLADLTEKGSRRGGGGAAAGGTGGNARPAALSAVGGGGSAVAAGSGERGGSSGNDVEVKSSGADVCMADSAGRGDRGDGGGETQRSTGGETDEVCGVLARVCCRFVPALRVPCPVSRVTVVVVVRCRTPTTRRTCGGTSA
jgi:hypothetical protein